MIKDRLQAKWLERSKKIYDAVHGFIRFNSLEKEVIDSEPFQRLHGIHQLGIAYLVYPGATHTRFEHSLGTMHLSSQIFERIVAKGFELDDIVYWEQVVRLAALCHDLGHLPFSHDAEKELLGKAGHEEWTLKAICHLKPLWEQVLDFFPGRNVQADIIKMAIGETKLLAMGQTFSFSPTERVLSHIVTGDFFGADRIDYLLRDAQCTGVSHGFFDYLQLIEMLCVAQVEGRLEMCIEENGVESCEALLLARHFMHKRVYGYPSVKICKHHLASFMQVFFKGQQFLESIENYFSLTDHEILSALRKAARDSDALGHKEARALIDRKQRFCAIVIQNTQDGNTLSSRLQEGGVPEEMFWIDSPHAMSTKGKPAFFVKTKSQEIAPASLFCQIAFHPKQEQMLYLNPAFEGKARQALASV